MGISDDIRPKKIHHHREKTIDVPVFDDDDEENEPIEKPEEEKGRFDSGALEHLENDFFEDKKKHNQKSEDNEDEEKPKKTTPGHRKSLAKPIVWLMTISLLCVLGWQNRSTIIDAFKKNILKENSTSTTSTSNAKDEFYTGEPATSSDTSTSATATTETPTTTPTTAIDKTGITIEVLNGNGIKNSGSRVKSELEAAGFKVSKVTNAKNFNYKTTLIYFKTGKDKESELVKAALADRQVSTEQNDTLVGDYDIIVIIGAK